ncbi:hypothetical protein D3C72_705950 [compost metagenome]
MVYEFGAEGLYVQTTALIHRQVLDIAQYGIGTVHEIAAGQVEVLDIHMRIIHACFQTRGIIVIKGKVYILEQQIVQPDNPAARIGTAYRVFRYHFGFSLCFRIYFIKYQSRVCLIQVQVIDFDLSLQQAEVRHCCRKGFGLYIKIHGRLCIFKCKICPVQ